MFDTTFLLKEDRVNGKTKTRNETTFEGSRDQKTLGIHYARI